jgi:hypothetical protein
MVSDDLTNDARFIREAWKPVAEASRLTLDRDPSTEYWGHRTMLLPGDWGARVDIQLPDASTATVNQFAQWLDDLQRFLDPMSGFDNFRRLYVFRSIGSSRYSILTDWGNENNASEFISAPVYESIKQQIDEITGTAGVTTYGAFEIKSEAVSPAIQLYESLQDLTNPSAFAGSPYCVFEEWAIKPDEEKKFVDCCFGRHQAMALQVGMRRGLVGQFLNDRSKWLTMVSYVSERAGTTIDSIQSGGNCLDSAISTPVRTHWTSYRVYPRSVDRPAEQ